MEGFDPVQQVFWDLQTTIFEIPWFLGFNVFFLFSFVSATIGFQHLTGIPVACIGFWQVTYFLYWTKRRKRYLQHIQINIWELSKRSMNGVSFA